MDEGAEDFLILEDDDFSIPQKEIITESPFKNIKNIFSRGRNENNHENNNISPNINKIIS